MGYQDNGNSLVSVKILERGIEAFPSVGVKGGGRFVEDKDIRFVDERPRKERPLPQPTGQLADELVP
jgi:hypothetical protein